MTQILIFNFSFNPEFNQGDSNYKSIEEGLKTEIQKCLRKKSKMIAFVVEITGNSLLVNHGSRRGRSG